MTQHPGRPFHPQAIDKRIGRLAQIHQATPLSAIELLAGVVTGLLFLGTIISGGLLSMDKPMPTVILTMHRITPFLTVLSTAATLYLLLGRK